MLKKQKNLIIGLAIAFAVLLCAYLFIIKPLLTEDEVTTSATELIWEDEVSSTGTSILLFEHITRDDIQSIDIHNPDNDESYVDWGIFYNAEFNEEEGLYGETFYLKGYEYAIFNDEMFSYLITAAGYTICSSRIEDHCTDFSKYGLDFDDISEATYYTITTRDGISRTVIIGDVLPSGSGYYVRSYDVDTNLSTGEEMIRDSVYVLSDVYTSASIMKSPTNMVKAYLSMPIVANDPVDAFYLSVKDEKYFFPKVDDDGNPVLDENGEQIYQWEPVVYLKPVKSTTKNGFEAFSGSSTYYTAYPVGYYSSSSIENTINEVFQEFLGDEVMELAVTMYDADGEEYLDFPEGTMEKYGLDEYRYVLYYKYDGVENYIYFSELQEESYYYAYSVTFNMICRVNLTTAYFLDWDENTFISSQLFYLMIGDCNSVTINGSYYDLGVDAAGRDGMITVNHRYLLEGSGSKLIVTEKNSGKVIDTSYFRKLYQIIMQAYIRDTVTNEDIETAMNSDPITTISIVTNESVIYKKDDAGNETTDVDYTRPSVTRIYRFYTVTGGRVLCTIEDIDVNGVSSGENGSFYAMTSTVERILVASLELCDGQPIDISIRS